MNRLGFSISQDEATRYKQSIVCNESVLEFLTTNLNGSFSQWSADNVDHNVCTIDGKSTLHSMGMVVSTTPGRHTQDLTPIPWQKRRAAKEVINEEEIPIIEYDAPEETGLSAVTLKPIVQLNTENVLSSGLLFDYLWHGSYSLPNFRPNWLDYMSDVSAAYNNTGKAAISMLPIIDLSPNDMNCIYSTMCFIESQTRFSKLLHQL